MRRKNPKRCPKCKEYMDPVFNDGIGRHKSGMAWTPNRNQDPCGWRCFDCGHEEDVE